MSAIQELSLIQGAAKADSSPTLTLDAAKLDLSQVLSDKLDPVLSAIQGLAAQDASKPAATLDLSTVLSAIQGLTSAQDAAKPDLSPILTAMQGLGSKLDATQLDLSPVVTAIQGLASAPEPAKPDLSPVLTALLELGAKVDAAKLDASPGSLDLAQKMNADLLQEVRSLASRVESSISSQSTLVASMTELSSRFDGAACAKDLEEVGSKVDATKVFLSSILAAVQEVSSVVALDSLKSIALQLLSKTDNAEVLIAIAGLKPEAAAALAADVSKAVESLQGLAGQLATKADHASVMNALANWRPDAAATSAVMNKVLETLEGTKEVVASVEGARSEVLAAIQEARSDEAASAMGTAAAVREGRAEVMRALATLDGRAAEGRQARAAAEQALVGEVRQVRGDLMALVQVRKELAADSEWKAQNFRLIHAPSAGQDFRCSLLSAGMHGTIPARSLDAHVLGGGEAMLKPAFSHP